MHYTRKPAKKETAAQNAVQRFRDAGSGRLPVQPVGNGRKHFLLVRFHQQFMPGTGVQLAFNVLHTGVLQALDGAAHALAQVAHRVGVTGKEEQRQVFGHFARKAGSCRRRMPLNML